jgi:hypothetical protein
MTRTKFAWENGFLMPSWKGPLHSTELLIQARLSWQQSGLFPFTSYEVSLAS